MDRVQVAELLAFIAQYDGRHTNPDGDELWIALAQQARWDFDQAKRAVIVHAATSTDYLKPAHISTIIAQAHIAIKHSFRIPPYSAELSDDGPQFTAWVKEQARAYVNRMMKEWAKTGKLPSPLPHLDDE